MVRTKFQNGKMYRCSLQDVLLNISYKIISVAWVKGWQTDRVSCRYKSNFGLKACCYRFKSGKPILSRY